MNIPNSENPRVVIIGAGFAGINLAKRLGNKKLQVVLIDKHNYHTFQPLLYQVSSSGLEPDSIAYPVRKILRKYKNSFFRMAKVNFIDTKLNLIETTIGELQFDYLVIATGTTTNYFGNEITEANTMPMKSVPQALDIRSLILQNFEKAAIAKTEKAKKALLNFVLVGGGPTGVELSGAIAELKNNVLPMEYHDINKDYMEIHLLEGSERVLPPMSEHASKKAEKFLKELGVIVHCNTMVENYDGNVITTNNDLKLVSETVIWAAGVKGTPLEGISENSIEKKTKRYKVNKFNQVESFDNIFAIGDMALMITEDYPKGHPQVAQPAIQQGKALGKNLLRLIKGETMKPFDYFDKGTMATIGRNRAVVDLKYFKFGGFFAWYIWMFVHLMALVGFRNRVIVFFNWTYNYINFDKAARLIIRPYKK